MRAQNILVHLNILQHVNIGIPWQNRIFQACSQYFGVHEHFGTPYIGIILSWLLKVFLTFRILQKF